MLPTPIKASSALPGQDIDVQPGSWWRLASEGHEFAALPAPAHGLVLMVSEARVVDGALHTVVVHPHPLWPHRGKHPECKILAEEFLTSFRPEPEGAALREKEIADLLGKIEGLTKEIASPPEPMALLEKQKDRQEEVKADKVAQTPALPAGSANVPAALLPGQDIIAAQTAVETRIAAFEAQRQWIEGKTGDLKKEMSLVSTYQTEKVNGSLASISQETKKAESMLANVQTMRLFLGEDMQITQLRDGAGADASEPLTFMQRMLYLDEEIYVSGVLDGFSADLMRDLPKIFEEDFDLVERMLPTPRSVAIVRVRRFARELKVAEKLSVTELLDAIGALEADKRIHILVRDGERVHMITADKATSHAERLFPSRSEIDALFTDTHFGENRAITPTDVDYTDARAEHDTRALFYKRFLIILWGVHERSDVFGEFLPKGANWLDATIHSDRFRFIHDEENALTDGRMPIEEYIEAGKLAAKSGSRVIVNWRAAMDPDNAEKFCFWGKHRIEYRGDIAEDISLASLKAEGDKLVARAPVHYGRSVLFDPDKKPVSTPVILSSWCSHERVYSRPERLYERDLAEGWICLDDMTLEEVDAYIASREARQTYDKWLPLFVEARTLLAQEKAVADQIAQEMGYVSSIDRALFDKALKLWREANKWGWPETDAKRKRIALLVERIGNPSALVDLSKFHRSVLRIGMKATGDVFVVEDDGVMFASGTSMPWLTETTYSSPGASKPKSVRAISYFDLPEPGSLVVHEDPMLKARLLDRLGPFKIRKGSVLRANKSEKYRDWQAPRGLGGGNAKEIVHALQGNVDVIAGLEDILAGKDPQWIRQAVDRTYQGYRLRYGRDKIVQTPRLRLDLGILFGADYRDIKRAWVVSVMMHAPIFAIQNGEIDHVAKCVEATYKDPESMLDVLKRRALNSNAIQIRLRELDFADSLKTVSVETFCLSFGEGLSSLSSEGVEDEADLSWKERAATRCIQQSMKDHVWHYPKEQLREAALGLHFLGSDEAYALIETISRRSLTKTEG